MRTAVYLLGTLRQLWQWYVAWRHVALLLLGNVDFYEVGRHGRQVADLVVFIGFCLMLGSATKISSEGILRPH